MLHLRFRELPLLLGELRPRRNALIGNLTVDLMSGHLLRIQILRHVSERFNLMSSFPDGLKSGMHGHRACCRVSKSIVLYIVTRVCRYVGCRCLSAKGLNQLLCQHKYLFKALNY